MEEEIPGIREVQRGIARAELATPLPETILQNRRNRIRRSPEGCGVDTHRFPSVWVCTIRDPTRRGLCGQGRVQEEQDSQALSGPQVLAAPSASGSHTGPHTLMGCPPCFCFVGPPQTLPHCVC